MSRDQARWALGEKIQNGASSLMWIVAICLVTSVSLAQVDTAGKLVMSVAEQAASRDVAYLAVIVTGAVMAFGWWQSRQNNKLAHEAMVSAVETARALQRLADSIDGQHQETQVDEDINSLLKRRAKR